MPKIQYTFFDTKFSAGTLAIIDKANDIIDDYRKQGYDLTLRQLYYQFVARGFIPNKQTEYKRLGDIVNNGRLAGLIDWHAIEDRTRFIRNVVSARDDKAQLLKDAAHTFTIDKWESQEVRVEVWIEKDALVGVISGICRDLEVPYFSCRGYVSQSEMWTAAQRIKDAREYRDQSTVIIHLGDHDPSGIDMSRDIESRIKLFLSKDYDWPDNFFSIDRIALNMDQVQRFSPPPNPAKTTDSRYASYIGDYGTESWELDALEPKVLSDLVKDQVLQYREQTAWDDAEAEEKAGKADMMYIANNYSAIRDFLESRDR
jgi:hypothetical protein